jgi:hypothetical protein
LLEQKIAENGGLFPPKSELDQKHQSAFMQKRLHFSDPNSIKEISQSQEQKTAETTAYTT